MKALLGLKFFLWAMVIFIASTFTGAFHGCEDWELKYVRFNWPTRPFWWVYDQKESGHVGILQVEIMDGSLAGYLEACAQAARDLKKAGVKVVVVPVPEVMQYSNGNQRLIERIQAVGNVILGSRPETARSPSYKPMTRRDIDWWWVEHAFVHRINITWAPSTVNFLSELPPALNEFIPFGIRETHGKDFLPDVALEAIRKHMRGNDSSFIWRDADGVFVGQHRIPIWGDGVAYTKTSVYSDWRKDASASWEKSTGIAYESNSRDSTRAGDTVLSIFRDKIVIIDWFYTIASPIWPSYANRYWQIIDSIVSDTLLERHDEWDVALMAFFVALAALAFFRLRSILAIVIMLITGGLTMYGSLWLFNSKYVLLDPLYPLLALVASMLIFPVIKLAHEKTSMKEELKSLQAEKSRLEGELKQKQETPAR